MFAFGLFRPVSAATMGSGPSIEEQCFELKFAAKQLAKQSKKCEENAARAKLQVKAAIQKGNMDGARIFAETAIREKNQSLTYLRLSARVMAVYNRVETAAKMNAVTNNLAGVVKNMTSIMSSTMDVEKLSETMDKFEKQFEDLDIATKVMENTMQSTTATAMPEQQVENLLQEVADEYNLQFVSEVDGIGVGRDRIKAPAATTVAQAPERQAISVAASAPPPQPAAAATSQPAAAAAAAAAAPSSGAAASGGANSKRGGDDADEADLEARLRRLQGL